MTTMNDNTNPKTRREVAEEPIQLGDLWGMIWHHKLWYALSVAICVCIAIFYLYRTPSTYSRSSKVIIDESAENSAMRDLTAFTSNMARYRNAASGANVYNEVEAFNSPDLMQMVVERLSLQTRYVGKHFLRSREYYMNCPVEMSLVENYALGGLSFNLSREGADSYRLRKFRVDAIDDFEDEIVGRFGDTISTPAGVMVIDTTAYAEKWKNDIRISWTRSDLMAKSYGRSCQAVLSHKETSVINLTMSDAFPKRAELVLSTLVDVYNEEWIGNKTRSAIKTTNFINERLVIIEKELGAVENALKDFKEKNKITNIRSVSDYYLTESSQYGSKGFELRNQLSVARFIKDYLDDPAHEQSLIPANSGIQSNNIESQIKEYNEIVLKRNIFKAESSNDNLVVKNLDNSLSELRKAIKRSVDNLIGALELQTEKFDAQESEIMDRIASTSGQELELLAIERQQKIKEQLYVYLLQKREENEIASLVSVGNTRIIMKPTGSPMPVAPKSKMVLLIALIMGMGIPFAYYYLLSQIDNRIKTKSDVASLQTPFLAEIPQMRFAKNWFESLKANKFDNRNSRIVVKSGSRDMMNEAFRVLRTNLDMMFSHEEGCRKIMVTSFNPNSGKTFLLMNIAASMALKGTRTLILDLDMRKATLSGVLGSNKGGCASYLSGKTDDIKSLIHNVSDNLDLIAVGALPPNPAELLLSGRYKMMLDELSKDYDYIFIDCPPVDVVADTAIIAKAVDLTIFIVRAGLFDKRGLPEVDNIASSGRLGRMAVILNGVEMSSSKSYGHSYGYGSGYGYGYGYGYGSHDDKD